MIACVSRELAQSAASVWKLAGNFGGLAHISKNTLVSTLEDGGRVRCLTTLDGGIIRERLLHFDELRRSFCYEIIAVENCPGMSYGVGYRGRVTVLDLIPGQRCLWHYQAEFESMPGVTEAAAAAGVQSFVEDCIDGALQRLKAA